MAERLKILFVTVLNSFSAQKVFSKLSRPNDYNNKAERLKILFAAVLNSFSAQKVFSKLAKPSKKLLIFQNNDVSLYSLQTE